MMAPDARRTTRQRSRKQPKLDTSIAQFIPDCLKDFVIPYHGDFCASRCFDPRLIAQLMAEGFLPIASRDEILLPKLHQERCVIDLRDLHVSKSNRKRSRKYFLRVNSDYQRVVEECRIQHGDQCWLYDPLVEAFRKLNTHSYEGFVSQERVPVRLYSIEIYKEGTTQLVAGELGYTVGKVFTSLTGFKNEPNAGSVQLLALGRLLQKQGFVLWDLGMEMPYKMDLGAQLYERQVFLQHFHSLRLDDIRLSVSGRVNCRELIDSVCHDDDSEKKNAPG